MTGPTELAPPAGASSIRPSSEPGEAGVRRGRRTLLLAAVAIVAVATTHLVDFLAFHFRYRALNANVSTSWSHAVAAGALAVGVAVCLVGAWRSPRSRPVWIVTAAILALLFTDEASGLHAQIDALRHGKALYAPILVMLAFCVWQLTSGTAYVVGARTAAALLLVSYLIHVAEPHNIGHVFGWGRHDWPYQAVVALKEGSELGGVLVALFALSGAAAQESPARPRRLREREGDSGPRG